MVPLFAAFLLAAFHPAPAIAAPDYDEVMSQARSKAAAGDYPAAELALKLLAESYPGNPEILAALARVRLWQQDVAGAIGFFRQSLAVKDDPSVRKELEHAEKAGSLAQYRLRQNNLRIEGGIFAFSGDRPNEQDLAVTLTRHIGRLTAVVSGSQVRRFGLTDTQGGIEIYTPLGAHSPRSGHLAVTASPGASFLPRYTVGGEFYQGWSGMEGSLGFSRLGFSNSPANILIPGVTFYPTGTISVNERIYLVLDNGAVTSLTTLTWKPDPLFCAAYAVGVGSAAERFTSNVDLTRYFTLTNRVTSEYRITPTVSFGGELSHEYRRGLYTRTGATLFGRYWW